MKYLVLSLGLFLCGCLGSTVQEGINKYGVQNHSCCGNWTCCDKEDCCVEEEGEWFCKSKLCPKLKDEYPQK